MSNQKVQKVWINCAKFIAMLAVVIDHTNGILYTNRYVALSTYFSVTLFIFLSGITSFMSNKKHEHEMGFKETIRRISAIFIPYLIATAIYLIADNQFFDLKTFITYLLNFNISNHLYFVLFYIQLVVISPFLYKLIIKISTKANAWIKQLAVIIFLAVIAAFSIKYTLILPVHGGGQYLFGGTFLLIYYLGMLFGYKDYKFKSVKSACISTGICLCLLVCWLLFFFNNNFAIDQYFPFGDGFNPPSISETIYALLIGYFVFSFFSIFSTCKIKINDRIIAILNYLGNSTLYIYLYHKLVIIYLAFFTIQNIWLKRFVYLTLAIGLPILIKEISSLLKRLWTSLKR